MRSKKLCAYLSGGMEYAKGGGSDWRDNMQDWIEAELGHKVFNPNKASKAFLAKHKITQKRYRSLKKTNLEHYTKLVRKVVDLDSREVALTSDYVVCYWNTGAQRGAGTQGELTLAKYFAKPVYMVTKTKIIQIPGWVLGCTTKIFPSFLALTKFLMKRYKI